jgi:hypothetical protein
MAEDGRGLDFRSRRVLPASVVVQMPEGGEHVVREEASGYVLPS